MKNGNDEREDYMSDEWIEEEVQELNEQISALADEAESIVDEFWAYRAEGNARKNNKKKVSTLGLRVRKRNGGRHIGIEWYYNSFKKAGSGWKPFSHHIKKARGEFRYQNHSLLKRAQDWERDTVIEIEDRLAYYREKIAHLTKLRSSLERRQRVGKG